MLRIIVISLFILIFSKVFGQIATTTGEFLDERDGKSYQTLSVGTTVWLAENLKFKTVQSESHEIDDSGIELDGYYYPYEEIDEACPTGFRIPQSSEWEEYVSLLMEYKKIPTSSVQTFNAIKKGLEFVAIEVSENLLKPFDDPNPLNLKANGHTQAGDLVAIGSLNFWIKHDHSTDSKYHVHLIPEGYNIHSHKHHIVGRKKRLRKFSIRCVREEIME